MDINKQFFSWKEVKDFTKNNIEDVFIVQDYHKESIKFYVYNGKVYYYEFCGNLRYPLSKNPCINLPKFKREHYCFILTNIGKY